MPSSYTSLHYQVVFSTKRRVPHITARNGHPTDEPAESKISLYAARRSVAAAEAHGAVCTGLGPEQPGFGAGFAAPACESGACPGNMPV